MGFCHVLAPAMFYAQKSFLTCVFVDIHPVPDNGFIEILNRAAASRIESSSLSNSLDNSHPERWRMAVIFPGYAINTMELPGYLPSVALIVLQHQNVQRYDVFHRFRQGSD
ncbi:hypothetical protein [Citrobacter enshiensis]|uniref:hypothetical protein n=1 Tax=Citrobacter enshiensis TaxID=2971264 RepID=UPI00399D66B2